MKILLSTVRISLLTTDTQARLQANVCILSCHLYASYLATLFWNVASQFDISSPSSDHTISGVGLPSTSASSVKVSPSIARMSLGDLMKCGRTSTRFTEATNVT